MAKNNIYHYFVEGDCEEKLINTFKMPPYLYFQAGKVEVFNFINRKISNQRLTALSKNTIIILVYDIDVENTETLDENVKKLKDAGFKVHHIQSIRNFEEEIIFTSNLKNINDMFDTENIDDFKHRFINQKNIDKRLEKIEFDKTKMWSRLNNKSPFNKYSKRDSLNLIRKK